MQYKELFSTLSSGNWGEQDYRPLLGELTLDTQRALESFKPLATGASSGNPIQLIDFFSGAGGMSLGFAALNAVVPAFELLGGCDIDARSAETYSRNFGTPLINRDVLDLAYAPGELDALLDELGYDRARPSILIGCAPCQGFTSHRKRYWNEADDMRNSLIMSFAEIVRRMSPDAIIMENVPEFLSKRYWRYFSAAKSVFEECGYTVKACIYNAAAFGVPQERFRSMVIGMKHDFALPAGYLEPGEYRTVRDAIGALNPVAAGVADPDDAMHKSAAHRPGTIEIIKQVPHNGGSRPTGVGPACLDKVKGFYDVYGRLYWDKPAITITHYARNPASGRYTHPEQDRGLTAREAALLQSFPNGFEFAGKFDDIFRQIGEAVPPMLASAMAAALLIELVSCSPNGAEASLSPDCIDAPVSSSFSSLLAGIKARGGNRQL